MTEPDVSIVIPIYNEAVLVESVVSELCAALDARAFDYEILLAENGSTDGTTEILRAVEGKRPRVRHLHLGEPNYGKALKAGILAARGRYVICDEIDLCDVNFYERALPLLDGASAVDMVIGSKAMRGASDERPWLRRTGTHVINSLLRIFLGFKGTDTHGLKAFRRERLLDVAGACVVDRDLFASEFVIRAVRMGRRVTEIPISLHEKRPPSVHLLRRVPRVLRSLARLFWIIRVRHR